MMRSSLARPLACLFLACLAVAPLRAQEPPKFLIESIVVEGVSRAAGRQIVAAESLLQPGQTYSEPQLRQAVYRVKRLPFVVDAEFSLRKGSERGAYELVIKVEEATPVFFQAEADAQRAQQIDFFTGRKRTETIWQRFGTLGGRMFVGSHGLAYGSAERFQHENGEFVQAGYTQYDLFGAGSFAGVAATALEGFPGSNRDTVSLFGGVPLTAAQSFRVDLIWDHSKNDFGDGGFNQGLAGDISAAWIYNTTDDPLFPMSGTSASVGATFGLDRGLQRGVLGDQVFDSPIHNRFFSIGGGETYHRPLTARQSLELGGTFNWSVSSSREQPGDARSFQGALLVGHSVSLWGYERTQRFGDLRLENLVVASYYDANSSFGALPAKSVDLISSLGYRSRWGVVRLSFTYSGVWTNY